MGLLRGALAASVTPLRAAGGEIDEDAFGPLVDFFVASGLDGAGGAEACRFERAPDSACRTVFTDCVNSFSFAPDVRQSSPIANGRPVRSGEVMV